MHDYCSVILRRVSQVLELRFGRSLLKLYHCSLREKLEILKDTKIAPSLFLSPLSHTRGRLCSCDQAFVPYRDVGSTHKHVRPLLQCSVPWLPCVLKCRVHSSTRPTFAPVQCALVAVSCASSL